MKFVQSLRDLLGTHPDITFISYAVHTAINDIPSTLIYGPVLHQEQRLSDLLFWFEKTYPDVYEDVRDAMVDSINDGSYDGVERAEVIPAFNYETARVIATL